MKEKKGVTLIALVITIIIIMILASIAIYSGASTIRYVNFNKAKSEIQVIQSYVNEWYKEYEKCETDEEKVAFLNNYGQALADYIDNDEAKQTECDNTFAGAGINSESKQANYKFFSAEELKEKLGLDTSFDYLISIKDRNTILYNGVVYNKDIFYTIDDFGLQNIKETSDNEIEFTVVRKKYRYYNIRFSNKIY